MQVKVEAKGFEELMRLAESLVAVCDEGLSEALDELAAEAVTLAKNNLYSYEYYHKPTKVYDSIKAEIPAPLVRQITADGGAAIYIEYGTGIVGKRHPHPNAKGKASYDRNGHGDAGWLYPSENLDDPTYDPDTGMAWTKGQPSRPFMYRTKVQMRDRAKHVMKLYFTKRLLKEKFNYVP